ncbi:MAG: class I SAM-dependent methyltransferase [Lachnospiraceae bacterium]|nr:class I SAM-dependent methyltransferase [Lachnospiraceae bacterium]
MDEKKYGKPIGDIVKIKNDFFSKNKEMLEMSARQADALLLQPKRTHCKICHEAISGEPLYSSQRMRYYLCPRCGHVNSENEDTEDFENRVYLVDSYENNYSEADREKYEARLKAIYMPKAEFLLERLDKEGLGPKEIRLLDDGAGSGYFVRAMRQLGTDAVGIEISKAQVEFANRMAGEEILSQTQGTDIPEILRKTDRNVLSFIGVFEHIVNLDEVIEAIRDNQKVEYVFLSVPMFSMSCVFEAAHQNCYNRHAGGTHTHLFSDQSLAYFADRMGFEEAGSWKFGSDMMDLYRMLCVCLDQNGNGALKDYFGPKFLSVLDDLQLVIDKSEFASETHLLLRRKGR